MTTIDEARTMLRELAEWTGALSESVDTILGVSSPRLSFTSGSGGSDARLPFGLDRAIDEPDKGGSGVRTEAGLLDLLGSWQRSIAHDRGEPVHGSPIAYLIATLAWAHEHADWEALTGDITDAHAAVARITGHVPQVVGKCLVPRCKGTVTADMLDDDGRRDYAWCDTCGTMYYSDPDSFRWQAEHVVDTHADEFRSVAVDASRTVTMKQALRIWPELDRKTFFDWIKAGRINGENGRFALREVNQLANVLVEKRKRHAEKEVTNKEVA